MMCAKARFDAVNSRGLPSGGSRLDLWWRACTALQVAALCDGDAPDGSRVSAFNVSWDIGRNRSTRFHRLTRDGHITTRESAQFLERVLGCAVDGKMCLSKATVRPAKKAEMPGPPRSRTTGACQFPRRAREPFGRRCRAAAPPCVLS